MINEMTLGIAAVSVILVLVGVLAYVFVKQKENTKKHNLLEASIDHITTEMHQLQKAMKEIQSKEKSLALGDDFQSNMEVGLSNFYQQLKEIKEHSKNEHNYFEEKILRLENRVRDFGYVGNNNDIDERRIIALFQEGWSVDSIAKELRIGRGEVEFTLKLADIESF
ncbi:hypothetical protein [Helicobacter mustelae]|uniref:Putative inner membrane protein n=1 Tax=Helicobacter mustelae (strain ATCC 43772 / CCUG 25715 / CIP 103759 / LMG 18044 / NCTC 12198 / R85-136P) TaxID=679897 RepID=D3UJ05_HELM1|nr:hypothetical protein [Helicobacter mustelae]CBG40480.1 putative inner membrane protein [Helicobacter mustelae 12198]SQH71979.1 putative inner membrane protein [Helicobacter mustelae]STP13122.1 putative inner membrane protein [Helicobacter mustelae]